jgi:hypothetical protein
MKNNFQLIIEQNGLVSTTKTIGNCDPLNDNGILSLD